MAIADTAVLSEIQLAMLEPTVDGGVTWTSTMWTAAEVLGYLNQRQNRFLKESCLLAAWTTIAVSAGQLRPALPDDWVATVRVAWKGSGALTYLKLPRADSWSADNGVPTWPSTTAVRPKVYMDAETPTLELQLAPAPTGAGTLSLYYVSTAAPGLDGLGELFIVPDEFVPYVKWGVLADMLSKVGRAMDPERAAYGEARFAEGVAIAKQWVTGGLW